MLIYKIMMWPLLPWGAWQNALKPKETESCPDGLPPAALPLPLRVFSQSGQFNNIFPAALLKANNVHKHIKAWSAFSKDCFTDALRTGSHPTVPHADCKSGGNLTRFIFAQFSKQTIKTISFLFGGRLGRGFLFFPPLPPQLPTVQVSQKRPFLVNEHLIFCLFLLDTEAWTNLISICNLCNIELQKETGKN